MSGWNLYQLLATLSEGNNLIVFGIHQIVEFRNYSLYFLLTLCGYDVLFFDILFLYHLSIVNRAKGSKNQ